MAYCVHCGVKLGDGEKRCPLCQTPVYDPAEPQRPAAPRAYPVRMPEQEIRKSKRFLLTLASLMLLAPAGRCLVIDWLVNSAFTWSVYAAGALILIFITVAVPVLVTRFRAYISVAAAFACLNGYLFLAERRSQSGSWFFPIVLPSLTLAALLILGIILLYRSGRLNVLTTVASSFAASALECVAVEWFINLSRGAGQGFIWSPFVLAPCLFLSFSLFFINGNRAVREEVRRRVHF